MANNVSGVLRLTFDGKNYFHETEASISFSTTFKDRVTKDTDGEESAPDIKRWTASGGGLVLHEVDDALKNALFEDLFDKWIGDVVVDVQFTTNASGQTAYQGKAWIESLEMNSNASEDPSATWSLKGIALPEKIIVPAV
ncbi:phage tail tube protein [Leeuwenhoekiella sp. LLG6367-2.1]|uniref:phage tail tube protein n=1 Tax=Leeuwenhoekiella sp. LLG6367-2.1 TaxID=3160833 RepID=UPI003866B881